MALTKEQIRIMDSITGLCNPYSEPKNNNAKMQH